MQRAAVRVVGDVAGDRDDVGLPGQLGAGGLERARLASVDHEPPPAAGELARESEPEAPGCPGDECGLHARPR